MDPLKIIGCTVAGGVIGWIAGLGVALRNMDMESVVYPPAGLIVGGFAGSVIGAVVFAR